MNLDKRSRRFSALKRQIDRLERRLDELRRREAKLANWRLGSFAALFIVGAFVFLTWGALPWAAVSLILLVPFALTVRWHRQVERSIRRHDLLCMLKQAQVARMSLDWDRMPQAESVRVAGRHPFAADLDLIGDRSILRLLDISITQEGSQQLCDWLLEIEPNPMETAQRQTLVKELIRLPALRDRLILNASMASDRVSEHSFNPSLTSAGIKNTKWSGDFLLRWLDKEIDAKSLRGILLILTILALFNLVLLIGFLTGSLPPIWLATWFIYAAIMLSQSRKVGPIFNEAAYLNDALRQMAAVFFTLEQRSFKQSPALRELLSPLRTTGRRPSEQLSKANKLLSAAGLRINPFVGFALNAIVPWDIFIAYRLTNFKQDLVELVPEWLDIWHRLEALNGLANFGVLYPEATFADFIDLGAEFRHSEEDSVGRDNIRPPFEAKNLGHPLIPPETRVDNDLVIEDLGMMLIITGSNMSGKSTFLRSLGVNICLAQAGAPVLAQSLRLIPFRIAASITVKDSLMDGFSFFYAEVSRLKALLDALQKPQTYPLFFLIDEIFRGTNNRERLIGSKAYVEALVGRFGTGAIATHDLELVRLADTTCNIHNAHFRDDINDGRMVFDYKLRSGPCPTTNALKIMHLAGLPIGDENIADVD